MRVSFEEFIFDRETRQLSEAGKPIHLSQRAFRLLDLLLSSAPSAISKDEIYRTLWGATFVDEANIPNLISELRTALDDQRRTHKLITTVHRFGYRFDGAIQDESRQRGRRARYLLSWGESEFPLEEGTHVIGRDRSCDIPIDSQGISRQHARLVISDGHAAVEDLGSKNGTYVRGARISAIEPLADGESIRLGSAWITLHRLDEDASTRTEIEK